MPPRYSAVPNPQWLCQNLKSPNLDRRVVAIVSEWQRGCTYCSDGKPWECEECTLGMLVAVKLAFRECKEPPKFLCWLKNIFRKGKGRNEVKNVVLV